MEKKIIIAIDGFSSSGKSTMAKQLAKEIGYAYVDSGAMYRAVTLYCIQKSCFPFSEKARCTLEKELDQIQISFKFNPGLQRNETLLNGVVVEDEIRNLEVSNKVSEVSSLAFVRKHLVTLQQAMGETKGIVMDGRDIASVVFPNAELKLFVTASPEIRAQRRYKELIAKGEQVSYDDILKNINDRDYMDQNRSESPLIQVKDAIVLDNGNMTVEEQRIFLLDQYHKTIQN